MNDTGRYQGALSRRRLNRTLLKRQHLLARVDASPQDLVRHLVALQAQDPLPPYLSLAARLESFDPYAVSQLLADAGLVRIVTLRGTVHLHLPDDAVTVRAWTQPFIERTSRTATLAHPAREIDRAVFAKALADVLADGPLPLPKIIEALAVEFPNVPGQALGLLARCTAPLCQLPPRGRWKRSGGVIYDDVRRWTGLTELAECDPDVPELVRRYLRAFGPASAADVTTWSGVTRLGPVVKAMPDLVHYADEQGRTLYDIPDGELADEDEPAPVRLLGTYDNVWLSHAGRDRTTDPDARAKWMGMNGGVAHVLLVDGWMAGLWRIVDGQVEVEPFRHLTRAEKAELAEETERVTELLAT